jgi:hypothetical protein
MNMLKSIAVLAPIALLGCAQIPTGPSVAVMPAPGKPFEVFIADDQLCRGYASQVIGGNANNVASQNFVGSAALGTAIGAAAGALAGGHEGAGAGAAVGLVAGSAVGAGEGGRSGYQMQRRYDIAYQQCMYAKGNQLPGQAVRQNIPPPPPPPPPHG